VPAAAPEHEPTAFEDAAVERSLASLQVPRVAAAGGIFADDSFELPSAIEADGALHSGDSQSSITLSRRTIYAYVILVPVIAAAAFGLGCWWTAAGGR
jgi:hypothetical protein